MTPKQKRMHGMLYRARRNGAKIDTKTRSIYRAYNENTPPGRQEAVLINEFQFGIQLLIQ